MKIHAYCVEHDLGFAPNPFHGLCSLACCAPQIRKHAAIGDIIVGRGSARVGRRKNLVYWMEVSEIIRFDDYNANPRFASKLPTMSGSTMQRYGDNIYFRNDETGKFEQRDSFHSDVGGVQSEADIKTDTATTDKLLLSNRFTYFGGTGPEIPPGLLTMFPRRGRQCNHPTDQVAAMLDWLDVSHPRGIVGLPTDWRDIPH